MILVAGGQLDPNIGRLLRRLLSRGVAFRDLLVGPKLNPEVSLDFSTGKFCLNGEVIVPSAGFMRHDVFLQQNDRSPQAAASALNWFHAIRGWLTADNTIKCFNRRSEGVENNKLRNLSLAREIGLPIPETMITNNFEAPNVQLTAMELVQKPVAGGELTTLLDSLRESIVTAPLISQYPRFIQERLKRPELRVYRIGDEVFGFYISSDDLDYRSNNRVTLEPGEVPISIKRGFWALCERLGLDFAAGDFMKRECDGEYCFLEVNTQPMFAAFDIATDGKVCDAIIDYLCS